MYDIDIFLEVDPYPKQRPRLGRDGRAYTPENTRKNSTHLKYELRAKCRPTLFDVPVRVICDFYIKKPNKMPKNRIYPDVRPDIDNYIKQILDAGNRYLWTDDGVVVEITARKIYAKKEGYIHLKVEKIK